MTKTLIVAALTFILWQSDTAPIKCHAESNSCNYGPMTALMSGYVYHSRHPDEKACEEAKALLLDTLSESNVARKEHAQNQLAMGQGDGMYERLLYAEPLCRVTGEDPNPVPSQSRQPRPQSGGYKLHIQDDPPVRAPMPESPQPEVPVPVPGDVPRPPK